jgi:hypothetical protein
MINRGFERTARARMRPPRDLLARKAPGQHLLRAKAQLGTYFLAVVIAVACGGGGTAPATPPQSQPVAQISATSLTFGNQGTGTTSVSQLVTLSNTGNAMLTITGIGTSANFGQSNNCAGSVAASGSCTLNVTFSPAAAGVLSGTLTITDNSNGTTGSRQTVTLSGNGAAFLVSLSASSLNFASQVAETSSTAQTETITNEGTTNLAISTASIGGTNAGDFANSADTCTGTSVAPNGSCAVSVTFTPATTGNRSASLNFATSASGSLPTVSLAGLGIGPLAGVYTQRYDNGRTGQNTQEIYLTTSSVTKSRFGKLFSLPVDGPVYAQPLYMQNISIPNQGAHNVVFVATEHNSVYGFDADSQSTTPLWHVSFLTAGVTAVPDQDIGATYADIAPEVGITSTPVIDPATGTLYVVAATKELQVAFCTSNCTYNYFHRLHALDISTGAEKFGGPVAISASVPGSGYDNVGGIVTFNALQQLQRPGLLLLNGTVYLGFGSHADYDPYHGWLMAYNAATLAQVAVFNVTSNGQEGAIWGAGGGISADANGYIYVVTANGTFDANMGGGDYSDSVLKMQIQSGQFQVLDYFTPYNQAVLEADDLDLGSSPALILPDQPGATPHLLAMGGKDGRIWLINRDNLGHIQLNDAGAVQVIADGSDSLFGGGTYWNGNFYVQENGDYLKQYALTDGTAPNPPTLSQFSAAFPNVQPVVSANGTNDLSAVLWLVYRAGGASVPAVLYAFNATLVSMDELYDSTQAPSQRDQAGLGVKFVVPTVANGKVYFGTQGEVDVYGILP